MTISLKHAFQSAKADGGDATIVQPSNWNAEHTLTQATGQILGRVSASTGPTEELTPAQVQGLILADPSIISGNALAVSALAQPVNVRLSATVASNALTIALKTQAGADASASDPVVVPMRSATANTDGLTRRTFASAASIVVPSSATLGHISGAASAIYVYAIDNAGTLELAVSSFYFGTSGIHTTTAISASATSATVMYSTSTRTNVAFRFLALLTSSQTTAGTWATVPQNARPGLLDTAIKGVEYFSASGTFTQRAGCFDALVFVWGGGGSGGAGVGDSGGGGGGCAIRRIRGLPPGQAVTVTVGAAAGTSSFGSYCSATGGGTATAGNGSGGDVNIAGSLGNYGISGVTVGPGGQAARGGGGGGAAGAFVSGGHAPGGGGTSSGGTGAAGGVLVYFW